ncbi:flavodoxin domain-containing protein [Eubacterium sp.]|uniref:flavodoxin domain-containing protein n=1 Tax=Eubacterium sp. TaxID=142586 RepID=UPI0026E071BE|nr:flavodoxin domain-containing protein [Eubacterium sp.]MDO5431392.1 flavodoxin domain-containing protein [Eubacterium sp.]
MSKKAVIYASEYGSTETYAKWLAQELCVQAFSLKKMKPEVLKESDILVYGGGIYASGIKGIKMFKKKCGSFQYKKIIIFTVGLADPEKTDYSEILKSNFSEEERKNFKFFHLRGAIDYKKLSLPHRAMMAMMMKMLKSKPESFKENTDFFESYGKMIDFKDKSALAPVIEYIEQISD